MKSSKEIRHDFISFLKSKEHTFIPSAPVVPQDDPTLLFTNAGMNQFKSIFLGDNPRNLTRAVNSQKCMRVSGKQNDLSEKRSWLTRCRGCWTPSNRWQHR
jgi:alanyl-tRNA synthetase